MAETVDLLRPSRLFECADIETATRVLLDAGYERSIFDPTHSRHPERQADIWEAAFH